MKNKLLYLVALSLTFLSACGSPPASNPALNATTASPKPAASPSPTPVVETTPLKDGDYDGKGLVTKIDPELASVEIDHEEIKGLMPPMIMEFFVSDKKMLDAVKVGDRVDFVVRYKGGGETIVSLKKEK